MSFRIGDKVEAVKEYPRWYNIGDILTVVDIRGGWVYINSTIDPHLKYGGFHSHDFIPVNDTDTNTNEGNTNNVDTNLNIIRLLTTVAVINSSTFAKQTPTKQTEILTLAAGKTVLFVDNFTTLSNTKRIAERLLAGEDVKMELEFNSIELSDDERKAIDAVRPVLEKLNALKGSSYEFLPDSEIRHAQLSMNLYDNRVRRGGYEVSKAQAKRLWAAYVAFVMEGKRPASSLRIQTDGYNREVLFNDDKTITIGCQRNIPRVDIEAIAKHFNLDA